MGSNPAAPTIRIYSLYGFRKGFFYVYLEDAMIRTLQLICSECKENFIPEGILYYRDNYISNSIRDTKFICPKCIEAWKSKWQIKSAEFFEEDYVLTVTIELENGTIYNNMDCTPIDETETVVTGEDIPVEAQKKLYEIYAKWDQERKSHMLKDCTFNDEFMRTTFSCETYSGEEFENIAFRFNVKGNLETEKPVPDYIKEQIIEAYKIYEAQNMED